MSTKIINITQQFVDRKIDELIESSSHTCDSSVFDSSLRQKLVVRVLNSISPHYVFCEEPNANTSEAYQACVPPEDEAKMESLIRQSIAQILQDENRFQYIDKYPKSDAPEEPSHWFG
jgi:hypothetical protein